jgi:hypothetical protein
MKNFSFLSDYEGLLCRITLATDETRNKPFYYIYRLEELQEMIVNPEYVLSNGEKELTLNDELLFDDRKWKIIDFSFGVMALF